MIEKLRDILSEYITGNTDDITEKTELRGELGLTSLDLINIAVAIEDKLGVAIPDRQVSMLRTVGDVVRFLEAA